MAPGPTVTTEELVKFGLDPENFQRLLLAAADLGSDAFRICVLRVDPTTKRLLVDIGTTAITIGAVKIEDNDTGTRVDVIATLGLGRDSMAVQDTPARSLEEGEQTVAAAGTPVKLISTSTPCLSVVIHADQDNRQAIIFVKKSVASPGVGLRLYKGDFVAIPIDDVSKVFIDSNVDGAKVSWLAVVA